MKTTRFPTKDEITMWKEGTVDCLPPGPKHGMPQLRFKLEGVDHKFVFYFEPEEIERVRDWAIQYTRSGQ